MAIRSSLFRAKGLSERERKNLAILEAIKRGGPITRSEISKATGLNIVTVTNYINNFIGKGLVLEKGLDVSGGGRKPGLVELNAKAGFVIGIDLGVMGIAKVPMIALLTDLATHVEVKVKKERPSEDMEKVIARSTDLIQEVLKRSKVKPADVNGLGLGISGVIDEKAGTIRDSTWGGITSSYAAIKNSIEQKFGIPTFIGNDATIAAFGEKDIGLGKDVEDMVYMYSDFGCGIVINGEIYCGVTGSAGELGLNVSEEDLTWFQTHPFLRPGEVDLGIPIKARKALEAGVRSKISTLVEGDLGQITTTVIVRAAKEGDKLAMELIGDAGVNLGIRVAYLINLFNPEVVVIGGGIEEAGALLFDSVRKTVRRCAFEEAASTAKIVPARLGEDSVALGAASIVIRGVFAQA